MDLRRLPIAYRFGQIQRPEREEWPEQSNVDYPRPPNDWQFEGFSRPWRALFRPNVSLDQAQIISTGAATVVWNQLQHSYWVLPASCVGRTQEVEPAEDWHRLHFEDLGQYEMLRNGLWMVVGHGSAEQIDSVCSEGFSEFLPRQYFRYNATNRRTHLVGELPLMLGLTALVPEDDQMIVNHIEKYFFRGGRPAFVPCREHREYEPFNRDAVTQTRALVMEVGLIADQIAEDTEGILREWERGCRGAMVSSHNPTTEEEEAWGLRG